MTSSPHSPAAFAARSPSRCAATATVLALVLAACSGDPAPPKGGKGPPPATVTTAVVRVQPWQDAIAAIGTVKARESVAVTAKVSEIVQAVHFDSGDQVAAGARLLTLGGRQQQAALAAAQAEADEAERMYRRQSELAERQLVARASLDTQRATLDAARARAASIRADIGDRTIRAPFAGVLGIRQVSPGALVTPGTVIATLDDIARVHVDFPVPEGRIAHVATGRAVAGEAAAYPGRRFDGTVSAVDARIDPSTRAVVVRADFPNPDRLLRPGMLLEVSLAEAPRRALAIPEIAVVQVGRESFVYRVGDDDTVAQVPVQVGARVAGRVEIVSGLQTGDRIVVDGTGKLRPGSRIVDRSPDATPGPSKKDAPRRAAPATPAGG